MAPNLGLGVPVMKNFFGFTKLMESVDRGLVPYVHNNWDVNDGVAAGWNNIVARARQDGTIHLIIVNDDVTFAPGAINKLLYKFMQHPEIDLLSAVNHDADSEEVLTQVKPDYSCFMIRPYEFVNKFGWFDEKFKLGYFEDDDMEYRIKVAGGLSGLYQGARIYHEGSATQFFDGEENRVVSHDQFDANRARYTGKWGGIYGTEKFIVPFNGMLPSYQSHKDW